jgi:hypothetical protein
MGRDAMKHITNVAESLGLVDPERIAGIVHGIPVKQFCKLVEVTVKAIFADEKADEGNTGSAVLASSSFRSDSGCRCWGCRRVKLDALARYACLYADRLVLPIALRALLTDEEPARIAMADLYYKVSVLRPLFDAGVAVFAPDIHCFCMGCGDKFDKLCDPYDAASFDTYLDRVGVDIRVTYRPPTRARSWYVELDGPHDYIPHGHLVMQPTGDYTKTPRWAPRTLGRIGGRDGVDIAPDKIRKFRIAGRHFGELARDAVIQQYSGVKYNAPYVTDTPVEARFLERVYPADAMASNVRELVSQMNHEIPLLAELPLRRLLTIRRSDYESFLSYRAAMQQLIRDCIATGGHIDRDSAREICLDIIAPQVRKLRVDAKVKRKSAIRKAIGGTAAVSAAIGLGLLSGMIPPELQRVFQIGGVALAGKLGDIIGAIEKHPSEIRSHNMYFLLKLISQAPE